MYLINQVFSDENLMILASPMSNSFLHKGNQSTKAPGAPLPTKNKWELPGNNAEQRHKNLHWKQIESYIMRMITK